MLKRLILPAVVIATSVFVAPVLGQETPDASNGQTIVPNATPAGPNFDADVQPNEMPDADAMESPDETTSGAPNATTGQQDLDADADADSKDEDTAVRPAN